MVARKKKDKIGNHKNDNNDNKDEKQWTNVQYEDAHFYLACDHQHKLNLMMIKTL